MENYNTDGLLIQNVWKPTTPKYRAYFFGNMYLSGIQHGIQAAHVVTRMMTTYNDDTPERTVMLEWATESMTKDLRVGGFQSTLQSIHEILSKTCPVIGVPFTLFHEEQNALNGALTSVGVVLDTNRLDSAGTSFVGYSIPQLLDAVNYELRGDGLSAMEANAMLAGLVKACRRAS